MPFVLDASVAANWLLPDETPAASAAWIRIADDDALVPLHWWFEVRNIVLVAERRNRIPPRHSAYMLRRLAIMRIVEADRPDETVALSLAREHALTFYDAAYLELALREHVPLATLDQRVIDAARTEGVELISEAA